MKKDHTVVQTKKKAGFRRQMFSLLAVFALMVLALLWVFQIFLLKPMYESVKQHEMRTVSRVISEKVGSEELQTLSDRLAKRTNICISVYEIFRQNAVLRSFSHIHSSCIIHNLASNEVMNRLYAGALKNGYYTERIAGNFLSGGNTGGDIPESMIAAQIVQSDGASFLVLLNTEIEPVGTTADTLTIQLAVISVIMLLISAAIAVPVSGRLTRPISQMSREANKLALGNYDVHFDGGNTRETSELGDALNYAAQELSALDSMQKELIANISHDLRTPLTMIAGYSEVMRDIPGEMTPENMQIIIDETQRLTALVNDILDLSKLKNGDQTLNCEVISLTDTVRSTMARYSKLCTHDGYRISFVCDRDAYIYADRSKILQVLYNLVNNAVNYTGEDKTVTIRQICREGMCRIEVTDTGEGIPKEQLPLIWDRYYKVKNYYKRSVTGSGLGLSIVKNILILHGAKFGVQSEEGHGSTFWFELPETPAPASDG